MSANASVAECISDADPRLGVGEAAVIVIIVIVAAVLTMDGMALDDVLRLLGSISLLALAVVRLRATRRPRAGALRRAGEALLSPAHA